MVKQKENIRSIIERVIVVFVSGLAFAEGKSFSGKGAKTVKSILIKDTTREERIRIVQQSLWGACGSDCEFCSGCDNLGGGRAESIYQPYVDGLKEIREINEEYNAPLVRG